MKKTKLGQRFENAFTAFFDDGNLAEEHFLTYSSGTSFLQENTSAASTAKAEDLTKILKQIFLFFPGAIVLFSLSSLVTFIPLINQYNTIRLDKPISLLLTCFISAFLVWFGIGDLKKPKYLIIPGSIVVTGFIAGLITASTTIWFNLFPLSSDMLIYSIYFLPLALIISFLVKFWIDETETAQ